MWRLWDLRFTWQCWWIKVFWDVSLCRLVNSLKGHGASIFRCRQSSTWPWGWRQYVLHKVSNLYATMCHPIISSLNLKLCFTMQTTNLAVFEIVAKYDESHIYGSKFGHENCNWRKFKLMMLLAEDHRNWTLHAVDVKCRFSLHQQGLSSLLPSR